MARTTTALTRAARRRREAPQSVPCPTCDVDVVLVDTTWGELQPVEPVPGVRLVGELELVELVRVGAALVDTRVAGSRDGVTLPGSMHVPHDHVLEHGLDPDRISVLFCNGPQCPQTPDALRQLADHGHPLEMLCYYRGGLHDWVTLGMPTEAV